MPSLLKEVLDIFGYTKENQQIALVKLAAYRNCFGDSYKDRKISDISDKEALELLKTPFESLIEGIKWWCDVTDKNWLRKNFKIESVGTNQDAFINVERWLLQPEKPAINKDGQEILKIFRALKLVDSIELPEEEKPDYFFIHGGLEKELKRRVGCLSQLRLPDGAVIRLGTNIRFLFNHETEAFAEIVAKFFGYTGEKLVWGIKAITAVLEENIDFKTSNKNWLKDPKALQQAILDKLGEKEWYIDKGWYFKNRELYEEAAKNEKRPCVALPTAPDMLEHFIQKIALTEPGKFKNIKIVPVYSFRSGRVATTEDNIEDFLSDEKIRNCTIAFISDNGCHYVNYQDVITKETIKRLEETYGKMNIKVITVGLGRNEINLLGGLDVLAKQFYSQKSSILKSLINPVVKEEKSIQSQLVEEFSELAIYPLPFSGYILVTAQDASRETCYSVNLYKNHLTKQNELLGKLVARFGNQLVYDNRPPLKFSEYGPSPKCDDYFVVVDNRNPLKLSESDKKQILFYIFAQWAEKAGKSELSSRNNRTSLTYRDGPIGTMYDSRSDFFDDEPIYSDNVSDDLLQQELDIFYKLSKLNQRRTLYSTLSVAPFCSWGISIDAIEIALREFYIRYLPSKQLLDGIKTIKKEFDINNPLLNMPREIKKMIQEKESFKKPTILKSESSQKIFNSSEILDINLDGLLSITRNTDIVGGLRLFFDYRKSYVELKEIENKLSKANIKCVAIDKIVTSLPYIKVFETSVNDFMEFIKDKSNEKNFTIKYDS